MCHVEAEKPENLRYAPCPKPLQLVLKVLGTETRPGILRRALGSFKTAISKQTLSLRCCVRLVMDDGNPRPFCALGEVAALYVLMVTCRVLASLTTTEAARRGWTVEQAGFHADLFSLLVTCVPSFD